MNGPKKNRTALWVLAGLVILGMAVPVVSATPAPVLNPSAPPQSWAYGGQGTFNEQFNLTGEHNSSYHVHAFVAWSVVFTQTNTSTSNFTLTAVRSLDLALFAQGCAPACGGASNEVNVSMTGTERAFLAANITGNGSVDLENGTSVPAWALENASGTLASNFTENASWNVEHGDLSAPGSVYLSSSEQASGSLAFSPALGVLPLNVSAGMRWSSTSSYTSQGTGATACHWELSVANSSRGGSCSSNVTLDSTGVVQLQGADVGNGTVVLDHQRAQPIALGIEGLRGWHCQDGFFCMPSATSEWEDSNLGPGGFSQAFTSTAEIDYFHDAHHFGQIGALLDFQGAFNTPLTDSRSGGPMSELASVAPSALPVWTVQATPEPTSQASCLSTTGCTQGASGGSPSAPTGLGTLFPWVLVGVVALAGVGLVALYAGTRRPRYPTGSSVRPLSPYQPGPSVPGEPPRTN
jgi:hypothetical protein